MNSLSHKFNQHRLIALDPKDHKAGFTLIVEPQSKLPTQIWGPDGREIGKFNDDNYAHYWGEDYSPDLPQLNEQQRRELKRYIIAQQLVQQVSQPIEGSFGTTRTWYPEGQQLVVEIKIRKFDRESGEIDDEKEWQAMSALETQLGDYDIATWDITWDAADDGTPAMYLTIFCADQLRVRNYARINKD